MQFLMLLIFIFQKKIRFVIDISHLCLDLKRTQC